MSFRSNKMAPTSCPFRADGPVAPLRRPAAGPDRSAPGDLDAWTGRQRAARARPPLDIRRPRFGDPLPDTLDQHAGAVIFGGPMSANDSDHYVRREIDWIEIPLREQRPFLGICRARRCSRSIWAHRSRRILKAGWRSAITLSVRPRPDMRSARTGRSASITGTARDFICLPGAELLAAGDDFPVQVFPATATPSASSFIPT